MIDALNTFEMPLKLPATPSVSGAGRGADPAQMREKAVEFEGVFLAQMLAPMFTETTSEPPFGGGPAEDTWRSLQIQELGKTIARAGGIGLADHVYREMLMIQERQNP